MTLVEAMSTFFPTIQVVEEDGGEVERLDGVQVIIPIPVQTVHCGIERSGDELIALYPRSKVEGRVGDPEFIGSTVYIILEEMYPERIDEKGRTYPVSVFGSRAYATLKGKQGGIPEDFALTDCFEDASDTVEALVVWLHQARTDERLWMWGKKLT